MRKNLTLATVLALFSVTIVSAQEDVAGTEKNWKISGENTFMVNQSSFSNWSAGGINSFAANLLFNYNFNYQKENWNWDNKVIAGYGQSRQKTLGWRKNDDQLHFNSLLGYKAAEKWLYTFFANFNTQFTNGYQYDNNNNRTTISRAFAPAYLSFGPGIAFKESDNLRFNLSPASGRLIIVGDETLSAAGAFGVDPGKKLRTEFGAYFDAYYKAELMKNISIENSLKLFSNYLEDPQNVDVDYTLNLFLKVNEYISVNGALQLIYDDNTLIPRERNDGTIIAGSERPALQVRQAFGVGLTYKF